MAGFKEGRLTPEGLSTYAMKKQGDSDAASAQYSSKFSNAELQGYIRAAEFGRSSKSEGGFLEGAKKATLATFGVIGTVLSLGENAVVFASRLAAYKDKSTIPSFTENTFQDMMVKDWGMEDNLTTAIISLAPSIFLDPITYLSAGIGSIGKVSKLKSIAKSGLMAKKAHLLDGAQRAGRLIDKASDVKEIAKLNKMQSSILGKLDEVNKLIDKTADLSLSKTGNAILNKTTKDKIAKKLTGKKFKTNSLRADAEARLFPKAFKEAQDELVKSLSKDSVLHKKAVDAGGLKWGVGSNKVTILSGEQVNTFAKTSGITRALQFTANTPLGEAAETTLKFFRDVFVTKKSQKVGAHVAEDAKFISNISGDFILAEKAGIGKAVKHSTHMFRKLGQADEVVFGKAMKSARLLEESGEVSADLLPDILKEDITKHYRKIISEKNLVGEAKDKVLARSAEVKKVADEWIGMVAKMAKRAEVPEADIIKMYFPYFFKDKLPDVGQGFKLSDVYTPHQREFFKTAKTDGIGSMDNPAYVLALRNSTVLHANLQDAAYVSIANKFGVKFASSKAADAAGFVPLTSFSKGVSDDLLGQAVKKSNFENVYVPRHVSERITAEVGTKAVHIPIISTYTKLWKRSVTAFFPGFHARNATSNVVFNAMTIGGDAINPKLHKMGMDLILAKDPKVLDAVIHTAAGEPTSIRKLRDLAVKNKVVGGNNIWDDVVGGMTKDLDPQEVGMMHNLLLRKMNPFSQNNIGVDFGSKIEDQARAVNFLSLTMKGVRPEMAAASAKKALIDYSDLTKAERWFKEAIPFYTFAAGNAKIQLNALATRPGIWASQVKLLNTVGPNNDQFDGLPEWVQDKISFSAFGKVIVPGSLPLEALLELVNKDSFTPNAKTTSGMMNPMLKYFLESGSGTDFRTERKIDELNRADEFKFIISIAKGAEKMGLPDTINLAKGAMKFLGLVEHPNGSVTGDPSTLHAFRNLFTSRWQATLKTLTSDEKTNLQKTMQLMFGVNAVDTNNKTRLYYNERNLFNEEVLKEVMSQGKAKRIIKFVGNKSSMGKYKNRKFNRRLRRYMDDISRFAKMGKSYGKKRRDAAKAELLKISGE